MDPTIDIKQRMTEHAAQLARRYLDDQRSRPGAVGRSPDGATEVTLNGLGDVTDVRLTTRDVPAEIASRLAVAFRQAWQDASRQLALAAAKDSPLADRPAVAELIDEQIHERYGAPIEPRPPSQEDEDFSDQTLLRANHPPTGR